jgi:hypothetical protein
MHRFFMIGVISLALTAGSQRAQAGYIYLEWLDCNPTYKLWAVSWQGPWNVVGGKHLDQGPTNNGPWTRVRSFVADSNCIFPAQNLRWYRIAKPRIPIGFQTLASIWVPLSKCWTGSFR